jgi:hypothetical protein
VFNFLDKAGVKTLAKPQNIIEGNITMILGLLWTMILEFDINRAMKVAFVCLGLCLCLFFFFLLFFYS